jgi:hypothetical protein
MRAPPPVEYISAPGRAWRATLHGLVMASIAVPLAWGLPYVAVHWGDRFPDPLLTLVANPGFQAAIVGWFVAMGLVFAWLQRRSSSASERTLRWDGQDWVLPGHAGGPELRGWASLMLDFGPWMLVSFRPHGSGVLAPRLWLPFSLSGDLARWSALRAALWSCTRQGGRQHR